MGTKKNQWKKFSGQLSADLSALTTILLGGTPAICNNRLLWIQAVKDHFDDVPLFVSCRRLLQLHIYCLPESTDL